jgi:hypothetical protein
MGRMFSVKRRKMRTTLAETVEDGGPSAIGRQGPLETVTLCPDRMTALIEDTWCEKIRGCSYRGSNTLPGAANTSSCMSMRTWMH